MTTIRPATADDLNDVLALLNATGRWLKSRGLDQWGNGFGPERIGPMIDRREMYIVHEDAESIATAAMSTDGDTDFWTPTELADNAVYLSKVTVTRDRAGEGLGEMLFRWLVDRAARNGADIVRLDAWRTNQDLLGYYERTGWSYIRTVEREHRRSGALFQKPAALDNDAWIAFTYTGTIVNTDPRYETGDRVVLEVDGQMENGVVMSSSCLEWTADSFVPPRPSYVIQAETGLYERGHYEVHRPANQII